MRTADEHAEAALALAPTPAPIEMALREALGQVTAVPVVARVDSPPFDNSAMDGFAVRWDDVRTAVAAAPVTLTIVGESRAGVPAAEVLTQGRAIRIMTGAPVPSGADTVVPVEVTEEDDGAVSIREVRSDGAHVRRRGEDVLSL